MFNDDYHDSTLHQSRVEESKQHRMNKMANALKACYDDYMYRAKWVMDNKLRGMLIERAGLVKKVLEECGYEVEVTC